MPTAANITVKNAASADVVYVVASPSAGDRVPAIWRFNAASPIMAHRPTFRLVLRTNGKQDGRVIEGSLRFPIVDDVNGVATQLAVVPLSFSGTLPMNVNTSWVTDAFIQFGNLVSSTLVRTAADEMSAPT
jgi:hypothetical protein